MEKQEAQRRARELRDRHHFDVRIDSRWINQPFDGIPMKDWYVEILLDDEVSYYCYDSGDVDAFLRSQVEQRVEQKQQDGSARMQKYLFCPICRHCFNAAARYYQDYADLPFLAHCGAPVELWEFDTQQPGVAGNKIADVVDYTYLSTLYNTYSQQPPMEPTLEPPRQARPLSQMLGLGYEPTPGTYNPAGMPEKLKEIQLVPDQPKFVYTAEQAGYALYRAGYIRICDYNGVYVWIPAIDRLTQPRYEPFQPGDKVMRRQGTLSHFTFTQSQIIGTYTLEIDKEQAA